MARKPKRSSRGSTFTGIIIGLVLGLAAAVAVALYVTKAPMPFYDRASREPNQIILPDVGDAPDPNVGLNYQRDDLPDDVKVPEPTPQQQQDELGQFIAGLGQLETVPKENSKATTQKQAGTPTKETTYFLQAGAFRSAKDANSIKAKILLMGLNANVQVAQLDGSPINRVRVGPFKGIDELNKARETLGAEEIETSVIRQ